MKQNWDLREAHEKNLSEVEELKRFQGSTFDTNARRRLVEDRDTILELTGKIQELQNEISCMNDSRDFQDAESVRSGHSHVASQPVFFPPHPDPSGKVSRSFGMPSRKDGPPHTWYFGKRFCKSSRVFFSTLSARVESVEFGKIRTDLLLTSGQGQSRPSAKNSVNPCEGDSSKNYGANQQRLQISDLHYDKFSTPATFACWKIRFKTEECTCSQFPTETMQWIKEVEMADSVDDLKSSSSIRGISMPNFEVLDARIASALKKTSIILTSRRRIQSGGTKGPERGPFSFAEDRLLTWSMSTSGSQEPMIVENYTDSCSLLFYEMMIFRNSKWDVILLSMTKNPHDDILEGLYKLGIRESEKLKTVLELYDLETHQKKLGPDYHRLKTMVKRSIEQDIRNKNFGIRTGNYEKNAVVKNQGTKQRVQRILGDCWQWETNGQCVKGDNCSFRHDLNKRGQMTQSNTSPNSFMQQDDRNASLTRSPRGRSPSGRTSRWPCKDYLRGTCNNSFCEKKAPSRTLVLQDQEWLSVWKNCSFAHRQVDDDFILFCCNWIVYSWRRSTVTDGVCKDNTSNDRFRDVKYATNWDTVWVAMTRQSRTTTSRRKELCTWYCVCVVKCSWRIKPLCWTVRRPTPMTTWKPRPTRSTWNPTMTWHTWWTRECARSC